ECVALQGIRRRSLGADRRGRTHRPTIGSEIADIEKLTGPPSPHLNWQVPFTRIANVPLAASDDPAPLRIDLTALVGLEDRQKGPPVEPGRWLDAANFHKCGRQVRQTH